LPKRLGRFEILDVLGQGGFNRVFLALDPTLDRLVALKVPRPSSMTDSASRRRFQREATAAAALGHPAIVPIFEAGSVGPIDFIAFAYCEGKTLSQWFEQQNRDIPAREAARIVSVLAEAVEHAHLKGVIHRDLKPANILLANDAELPSDSIAERLRITDFGLAKLQAGTGETLTIEGAIVGTPAYMSPEQARGATNITEATDVYSLGTIFYELLTGQLPFRRESHISTLRAIESESASAPRSLRAAIPKDLDAICLKCLAKEPGQRYASGHALSMDLQRWLEGRPVEARHATAREQLVAWRRRNPALAAVTLLALIAFLGGLAGTTWQWREARAHLAATQEESSRAKRLASFLGQTYRSPDPRRDGRDVKVVDVLARAEQEIATTFADDDESRWELLQHIASSYTGLGLIEEPLQILKRVRDEQIASGQPTSIESIYVLYDLANAHNSVGELTTALRLIDEAYEQLEQQPGANSDFAMKMLSRKAMILQNSGDRESAVALYRKVVEASERDPLVEPISLLKRKLQLGQALRALDLFDEATPLLSSVAEELAELAGPDHPSTLSAKTELLTCLHHQGKLEGELEIELRREIYEGTRRVMGEDHPQTLTAMSNLAVVLTKSNQTSESIPILEECVARSRETFGLESPYTMMPTYFLGEAHEKARDWDAALVQFDAAYPAFRASLGETHQRTLRCAFRLGMMLEHTGQWERVARLFAQVAEDHYAADGSESPEGFFAGALSGAARIFVGDVDDGMALVESWFASIPESLRSSDRSYRRFHMRLLAALLMRDEFDTALPYAEQYVQLAAGAESDAKDQFFSNLLAAAVFIGVGREEDATEFLEAALVEPVVLPGMRTEEERWLRKILTTLLEEASRDASPLRRLETRLKSQLETLDGSTSRQ